MPSSLYNGAIAATEQLESEIWTDRVENGVVHVVDRAMDEIYQGQNPNREFYQATPQTDKMNGQHTPLSEIEKTIDAPEQAVPNVSPMSLSTPK
ncbi:MAG: hypothetical protein H6861_00005 [Rhodospirillales bacterium]|nr:hypothetical protein [Rhodospirillales bacterium]